MVVDGWNAALVLGGIRSGKSAFAETLVSGAPAVRYVATASPGGGDDAEWAARIEAHRSHRPDSWMTEELGAEPQRLATLLTEAKPDETVLVDDLGGWVTAQLDGGTDALAEAVAGLADAVRLCAARLVIVSPEVGLSVVPATVLGRAFADELGLANRAVAEACDAVVLVVAGQPTWLKTPRPTPAPPPAPTPAPEPASTGPTSAGSEASASTTALHEPTLTLPAISTGLVIQPGMDLPMPDEASANLAGARLRGLDVAGGGLGGLSGVVEFAAGTQRRAVPTPWTSVRVLLVHGDHAGGVSAGDSAEEAARRARQAVEDEGPLGILAAEAGASLQLVRAPAGRPIETEDALTAMEVDQALGYGWRLAEEATDSGVDLLVIAACGAGAGAAAAAVTSAVTGAEPVAMLARADAPDGRYDDAAWMVRCAAVRDAMHRTRARPRGARDLLAALGGGDIAVVTGVLLGAASRRTPVLLDGPVGVAAGLVSRDIGGQARHWCLVPDHGGHPTVKHAADVLGLATALDLRLGLGEGATALAALPVLRSALILAANVARHPALAGDADEPRA